MLAGSMVALVTPMDVAGAVNYGDLGRLIDFGMARITGDHVEVHTMVPPVPPRLRRRLPLSLQDALIDHERSCLDSA